MIGSSKIRAGIRVLVVDDEPDWRTQIAGLLTDMGKLTVEVAEDAEQAMRLVRQKAYHIAIVDVRLDKKDLNNREGLSLAAQMKELLPELAIFVLTGHADVTSVKLALQPLESGSTLAYDLLEKHEVRMLPDRIERAVEREVRANPELVIELDESTRFSWATLSKNIAFLRHENAEIVESEITDLLQRIFYRAQHIRVRAAQINHRGRALILVTPKIEGLSKPDIDMIIRIGPRQQIEQEYNNFREFVESYQAGPRSILIRDPRVSSRLGGFAYLFLGSDLQPGELRTFGDLYEPSDTDRLKRILNSLFDDQLHDWYVRTLTATQASQSLSTCYREWLRIETRDLTRALRGLIGTPGGEFFFLDPDSRGHSPIIWHDRGIRFTNPIPLSRAIFPFIGPFSHTHGDLHENNLLVDIHDHAWPIDFCYTESGHPVRDFAMLESAIKFSLLRHDGSLKQVYEWENDLIRAWSLSQNPIIDTSFSLDEDLRKATDLISYIRTLVAQNLLGTTLRDYQISLFFHALKAMTLSSKLSRPQRLHAMISASVLADVLTDEKKGPSGYTLSEEEPNMSFTPDIGSGLAANLAYELLKAGATRLRATAMGTPQEQALQRAHQTAFATMLQRITPGLNQQEIQLIADILRTFVSEPAAASSLLDLALAGTQAPDLEQLRTSFDALDYDRDTLSVDFDDALTAYHTGLVEAIVAEAGEPDSPLYNYVSLSRLLAVQSRLQYHQASLQEGSQQVQALSDEVYQAIEAAVRAQFQNREVPDLALPSDMAELVAEVRNLLASILESQRPKAQPPDPRTPPVGRPIVTYDLDTSDRNQLTALLAARPEFTDDGARGRRVLLNSAGLAAFLTNVDLSGAPTTVAGDIVGRLERHGRLRDRPTHHALATLALHLQTLPDLGQGENNFLTDLIGRYNLITQEGEVINRVVSTSSGEYGSVVEGPSSDRSSDLIPDSGGLFDVFLSHNSTDQAGVEAVARRLLAEQIRPWFGPWHLVPGDPYQEAIESALDRCASVAVFVGPSGIGPWQNEEMRVAIEHRVESFRAGGPPFRVIPVLLPQGQEPQRKPLPSFLRRATWVKFDNGLDDPSALRALIAGIRGQAPGPGA